MLILTGTTDKYQVVTSAAATIDVVANYVDAPSPITPSSNITPGRQTTAISTATTTDVVAAPGASTVRTVKSVAIRNRHASLACDVTFLLDVSATDYEIHKATLNPGEALFYEEGVGWFEAAVATVDDLVKILTADATGQNVNTAQPWFPTAGGVTVTADTTYDISGLLALTRAAGTTSHTTGLLFAGTATLTSIQWHAIVNTGDVETNIAANRTVARVATNTTVKAASTSATETISILLNGVVRINAGGTFIPQFIYSAAPGGAPTVKANSYFILRRRGSGSFAAQGTWS